MALPVFIIIVWWLAIVSLFFYLKCQRDSKNTEPFDGKVQYEALPVVHDDCTDYSAQFVYYLQLIYGERSKRFFFPCATISIDFLVRGPNNTRETVATATLKPKLLQQNHRRFLKSSFAQRQTTNALFTLYKRKRPLKDIEWVLLNHDMHGGSLMVYSFFVLQLTKKTVSGSLIAKSIQCLKPGFDIGTQTFNYTFFGCCNKYVGPCLSLDTLETTCIVCTGISSIFLYCSIFIGRHFPPGHLLSLSEAIEGSLYAGLLAILLFFVLILIYQGLFKRLNAKRSNVGGIWLLMECLPFLIIALCILSDVGTVVLLLWPAVSEPSARLSVRLQKLWMTAMSLAVSIYLLAVALLLMALYLNGYYDQQTLPTLDFDSENVTLGSKEMHPKDVKGHTIKLESKKSKNASVSRRNLVIHSDLHEKSNLSQIPEGESVSKLIEATHDSHQTMGTLSRRNSAIKMHSVYVQLSTVSGK